MMYLGGSALLLLASSLQGVSGLLVLLFGCTAPYGRLGAGLWGGGLALGAAALGTLAALRPRPLHLALHLAISLLSMALNTLGLALTLTTMLRDTGQPLQSIHGGVWAGQWCGIGLLGAICLHLLATLVALPFSCRRVCAAEPGSPHDFHDTKHHLVNSWLGRHNPPILTPHHLLVEVPGGVYTLPYPPSVSPGYRPPPRRYRPPRSSRPSSQSQSQSQAQSQESPREPEKRPPKKKKREITDEEIEKTYTGLDREIAEEFISIAMQPKAPSTRSGSSISQIFP